MRAPRRPPRRACTRPTPAFEYPEGPASPAPRLVRLMWVGATWCRLDRVARSARLHGERCGYCRHPASAKASLMPRPADDLARREELDTRGQVLPVPWRNGRRPAALASLIIARVGCRTVTRTPMAASSRSITPRRSRTSATPVPPPLTEMMTCLCCSVGLSGSSGSRSGNVVTPSTPWSGPIRFLPPRAVPPSFATTQYWNWNLLRSASASAAASSAGSPSTGTPSVKSSGKVSRSRFRMRSTAR